MNSLMIKTKTKRFINFNFQQCKKILKQIFFKMQKKLNESFSKKCENFLFYLTSVRKFL